MEITCKFCNHPAPYTPLKEMEEYGAKIYFCKKCQAEYIHYEGGHPASYSLYVSIGDKMYRWTVSCWFGDHPAARLWYIASPGIPGECPNRDCTVVASFGQFFGKNGGNIPDITPRNIRQKIKTYLVML